MRSRTLDRSTIPKMTHYRDDLVNEALLKNALKSFEKVKQVEIVSMKVENGTDKGENFIGDLASVKFMAKIINEENDNQHQFKSYHWIIKLLRNTGGFNIARIVGIFNGEMNIYKVCTMYRPTKKCSVFTHSK